MSSNSAPPDAVPEAALVADRAFAQDREFLTGAFGIQLPAPELGSQENFFRIDRAELEELANAVNQLGPEGDAIVAFARSYLQTDT